MIDPQHMELCKAIREDYPKMNDLFIKLIIDYYENHTENEVNQLLNDKSKNSKCDAIEVCYFNVE